MAEFTPEPHHEAFSGTVNGGIIGALIDCHSNWTGAWALMRQSGADHPPCTVTAEFSVKLLRPTPSKSVLKLTAKPIEVLPDRVVVESKVEAEGKTCAVGRGTFVAVKPGHPAYHRW